MSKNFKIGIDMDQVIAELNNPWLEIINKNENENVKSEDITDWHMANFFKCGTKIYEYLTYDLFRNLPIVKNSQEVVRELSKKYQIYIVTSATSKPEIMVAKWEWLDEHFPFIPKDQVVMCGKKDVIKTDVLIDDAPHNLEGFQGEQKLLFDRPYNRKETRFVRVRDWEHIREMFL